jgi:hypothetical protein
MITAEGGTPPDFISCRQKHEVQDREGVRAVIEGQKKEGATWFRVTVVDDRDEIWVEGWLKPPEVQAPFEPLYTYAP